MKTWYPALVKPWFAPPDGLIPVVWIILFTRMGISLFLVWREGFDRPEVKAAICIFALQFVFNIAWSGAFFGMRSLYYGLIVIVLLWLMILLTIFKFWQVSRNAALLLVPYILSVLIIAFLFSFLHPEMILTIITDQNVLIMTRQY